MLYKACLAVRVLYKAASAGFFHVLYMTCSVVFYEAPVQL